MFGEGRWQESWSQEGNGDSSRPGFKCDIQSFIGIPGEKIALLRPARSLGRNMKTKNRFVDLENRKALVRVEAGLQVAGWEVETNGMRSVKCEDGRETDRGGNGESEDFIRKKDN